MKNKKLNMLLIINLLVIILLITNSFAWFASPFIQFTKKQNVELGGTNILFTTYLSFDGATDYIDIGNESGLDISGNITLEAWIKFSTSQSNRPIIAKWGDTNSYILIIPSTAANKVKFNIRVSGVTKSATSSSTYNDDNWHHIAAIFNGSNVLLYVDGDGETITGDATAGPITLTDDIVRFGNYSNQTSNGFIGNIKEIRIWNTVRTQEEIIANKSIYLYGNESGLIGYWRMEEGTGSSIVDLVSSNNGTITGATWVTP